MSFLHNFQNLRNFRDKNSYIHKSYEKNKALFRDTESPYPIDPFMDSY